MTDEQNHAAANPSELSVLLGQPNSTRSAHATLLNRLSEMQDAPYYATAREELALAEQTVLQLETDAALMSDLLDEAKSLLMEAVPGPGCAYADWLGARRELMARAGFRPNSELTRDDARRAEDSRGVLG